MAIVIATNPALPSDIPFPNEEARLFALHQALDEGEHSPALDEDIFERVREEFGFPTYNET